MTDRPAADHGVVAERVRVGRLPWVTHAAAAVGFFSWMVWGPIHEYGLTDADATITGLMSPGILVSAWVLVLPAAVLEAWAARSTRRLRRWVARVAGCVATLVLAWFGALPVGFRLFGDEEPVKQDEVRSAVDNYAVLIVGYLVLLLLLHGGLAVASRLAEKQRERTH